MSPANSVQQPNFPNPFPSKWAGAWGEDEYGLWMTLNFKKKNVQQTFRWIEPGTILMGSPENNLEHVLETPYTVNLTQGYWLAETACTLALWQAVTGDNPAGFKDHPNNPVEGVSWNDVQKFIVTLNKFVPDLNACLPTEAQWGYASQAGAPTSAPFALANYITSEHVNFNNRYHKIDGQKGVYREKTVPVKSLPANPWGLYAMDGNVLEWCSDWGDYSPEAVLGTNGQTGTSQVLRFGSPSDFVSSLRLHFPSRFKGDLKYLIFGFRLVLGHASTEPGK